MHEERHLRLERRALRGPLPPPQHLRHDVLQVFRKRKGDAFRAHRRDVVACRWLLAGQGLRRRCGSWRGLAMRLIARRRRRRPRDGAARSLRGGHRCRLLLGGSLECFRRLARFEVRLRRGNEADGVRRRQPDPASGCSEQEHTDEPVHDERARHRHAHRYLRATASSHRLIVSGSATRPTSRTPAPRITASTCTTRAYATRPSARRYTPVGRFVRTKAGNVARKSS